MAPRPPVRRRPGRPRSEQTDADITHAVRTLLLADSGLTVEAVARAGGVGKPTVYRRQRDDHLPDLLAFVLPQTQRELLPPGRPRYDPAALCGAVAERMTAPLQRRVIAQLLRDPTRLMAYLQPVASALRVSAGERADADALVADLLALTVGAALCTGDLEAARVTAARLAGARLRLPP